MIAQHSTLRIERLPISRLCVLETASCFPEKFSIYLDLLTSRPHEDVDPLIVRPLRSFPGMYAIENGKHRFAASIMAGRHDALCVIVEDEQ